MRATLAAIAVLVCAAVVPAAHAGEADVVGVAIHAESGGTWRFDVTVRHADTGWDHYADGWDVLAPDGTVLGTRTLFHPHVGEQPFTRSLGGVAIAAGIAEVTVRAHDKAHGYGGEAVSVAVPR